MQLVAKFRPKWIATKRASRSGASAKADRKSWQSAAPHSTSLTRPGPTTLFCGRRKQAPEPTTEEKKSKAKATTLKGFLQRVGNKHGKDASLEVYKRKLREAEARDVQKKVREQRKALKLKKKLQAKAEQRRLTIARATAKLIRRRAIQDKILRRRIEGARKRRQELLLLAVQDNVLCLTRVPDLEPFKVVRLKMLTLHGVIEHRVSAPIPLKITAVKRERARKAAEREDEIERQKRMRTTSCTRRSTRKSARSPPGAGRKAQTAGLGATCSATACLTKSATGVSL